MTLKTNLNHFILTLRQEPAIVGASLYVFDATYSRNHVYYTHDFCHSSSCTVIHDVLNRITLKNELFYTMMCGQLHYLQCMMYSIAEKKVLIGLCNVWKWKGSGMVVDINISKMAFKTLPMWINGTLMMHECWYGIVQCWGETFAVDINRHLCYHHLAVVWHENTVYFLWHCLVHVSVALREHWLLHLYIRQ